MKISELKQPYRRMAYYLKKNVNKDEDIEELGLCFYWHQTDVKFWLDVNYGNHPEITEEIKTHFPPDFDFSGEEQPIQLPNNPIIQNRIYTQLAKQGRFGELPETCEFSEPVELEVWDRVENKKIQIGKADVVGKFKGKFISLFINNEFAFWNFAQLPIPKIDFSQFKAGDVVEVVTKSHGTYYGIISEIIKDFIELSPDNKFMTNTHIKKELIETITKLK